MKPKARLEVRISEREMKKLEVNAQKCELTKSAYIRQLINGYKPREAPSMDFHKMTSELKSIGNNLNQIAYVANATGQIDAEEYHAIVSELRERVRRIETELLETGEYGDH